MNKGVRKAVDEARWHEEAAHGLRQVAQLAKILTDGTSFNCEISTGEIGKPVQITGCITNPVTAKQIIITYCESATANKNYMITLAGVSEQDKLEFRKSVEDRNYAFSEMLSMVKDRKFFWDLI